MVCCVWCCCTLVEKPYVPVILAHGGAVYIIFNIEQYWLLYSILLLLLIPLFIKLTHFLLFLFIRLMFYSSGLVLCKMSGWKLLNIVWKLFSESVLLLTHKTQECFVLFLFGVICIYLSYKYVFVIYLFIKLVPWFQCAYLLPP